MKEQIDLAIKWLKEQPIKGLITGSCLLDYFEGQDVDIFVYDEKSFTKLLFSMHHNPLFNILDPLEKWKFNKYINEGDSSFYKIGLITIKFTYNTCVPINIVYKKTCSNAFAVLSTFDLDIISKGYDIETGQLLDLSNSAGKIASWNKWNTNFYTAEVWKISRILRQLERCFKYHKRGYNTDALILKYIELIDGIQEYESIFNSENFNDKLKITKENTRIIRNICTLWLETHIISDEALELLKEKVKEI